MSCDRGATRRGPRELRRAVSLSAPAAFFPSDPRNEAPLPAAPSPFPTEADMLAPISKHVAAVVGRRRAGREPSVLFEFSVLDGVADLVALELDHQLMRQRDQLGLLPVVDQTCVRALVALRDGPESASALALKTGVSRPVLSRSVLPRLAAAGWVHRESRHLWRGRCYEPLARWIVAIEVKRRDWRHAVWQARRYRRFANRSVAVLDASVDLHGATRAISSQTQVGLAALNQRGRVEALHLPPWAAPYSQVEFALAGERAWAMVLEDRRSGPIPLVFGRLNSTIRGDDPRSPSGSADSRLQA